jgi:hypothetical protein
VSYTPRQVPTDPSQLSSFIDHELRAIARDLYSRDMNGGNAVGWRDMIGAVHVRPGGVNTATYADPTFAVYRGNVRQFQFAGAKCEFWGELHIDHDYKPGTDVYMHVHWSQIVVDTGGVAFAPGVVKWYMDVTYAKGHQQMAFASPITTSVTQTASSTQYQHMIAEVQLSASSPSASQIDTDDLEVDGLFLYRVYRDSGDAADTLNQSPFVHFVDIHYQTDRTNTRRKAPDFYV